MSFFGGGTDYPAYFREHGGAVLSTTFNKYCYISCRYLPPFFDYKYRIRYTKREETKTVDEIIHPTVRECLKLLEIDRGIEMVHTSDIPAGSGVGSSSAFTVGFLNALYALKGNITTKRKLGREAIYVEQTLVKENVGSQDQVAAAFGGFNKITFGGQNDFYVTPITIDKNRIQLLNDHIMLFFTGFSRTADKVAAEQIKNTPKKMPELRAMYEMVDEAINILNGSERSLIEFGRLLHESWKLKKTLSSQITTNHIDEIYKRAMKAGAVGGKILGAGGGGFIMVFAEPEKQHLIREELKDLLFVPFRFEDLGTQVIMYSTQDF